MEKKDRIDAVGATVLLGFSMLMGLNQVMIKLVNAGFSPVFQAGLRSACALHVRQPVPDAPSVHAYATQPVPLR